MLSSSFYHSRSFRSGLTARFTVLHYSRPFTYILPLMLPRPCFDPDRALSFSVAATLHNILVHVVTSLPHHVTYSFCIYNFSFDSYIRNCAHSFNFFHETLKTCFRPFISQAFDLVSSFFLAVYPSPSHPFMLQQKYSRV